MLRDIGQKMRHPTLGRYAIRFSYSVASRRRVTLFSRSHDRRAQAEAAGRGRAPEPRDQLRATEGDRAGSRARRLAGELGIQGGTRAPAIRDVTALPSPAPALQALGRASPLDLLR